MPLERSFATVYLDDPDNPDGHLEHRVEIRAQDNLRTEVTMKGMPDVELTDGLHVLYLSAWCALVRLKLYDGTVKRYLAELIDVVPDEDEPETVDPTQPEASAASA